MAIVERKLAKLAKDIRNTANYRCRKHTGQPLGTIDQHFGISDAAVSQVCKRFKARIEGDQELKREIAKLEKKMNVSEVET